MVIAVYRADGLSADEDQGRSADGAHDVLELLEKHGRGEWGLATHAASRDTVLLKFHGAERAVAGSASGG